MRREHKIVEGDRFNVKRLRTERLTPEFTSELVRSNKALCI